MHGAGGMSDLALGQEIAAWDARLQTYADPKSGGELMALLRLLYAAGRQDLPLGRLFEGHVDALQIVARYGTAGQVEAAAAYADRGAIFGVWNADLEGDRLRLDGSVLHGGKSFASGAGLLSHALVSVDRDGDRQLILLDLARSIPTIDAGWWCTTGMARSETHRVRWNGCGIETDDLIGQPGDYVREPWFGGGALRFASVQAGGVAAIFDKVRAHLIDTGRAADPHQAGRLSVLYGEAQAAAGAVRAAAGAWFDAPDPRKLALVSAARVAVYEAADKAITIAQQAVGVQAMFVGHPLAATLTDLTVYIRQPGPDAQRMRVGAAVADGTLGVDL
jgi:hypothetical protein